MLMKFEITIETDEAKPAEIYEGIQKAIEFITLPNGDEMFLDDAVLVYIDDEATNGIAARPT